MRIHGRTLSVVALASVLAILASVANHGAGRSVGLAIRIAKTRRCGPNDEAFNVVVQVQRDPIKINNEDIQPGDLERRLQSIFKTRVYRFIFVIGDPSLSFGDVAAVIDRATRQVVFSNMNWTLCSYVSSHMPVSGQSGEGIAKSASV